MLAPTFQQVRLLSAAAEAQTWSMTDVEPLSAEAQDFLKAIAEKRPPRSGSESGRNVVAALQAASLSLKENSRRVLLAEIFPKPSP